MRTVSVHILSTLLLLVALQGKSIPDQVSIKTWEDSVSHYLQMVQNSEKDQERIRANHHLVRVMEKTLSHPEAIEYSFPELDKMGVLDAPDGRFRLFNWNLPYDDQTHDYFAYLIIRKRKGGTKVTPLREATEEKKSPVRESPQKPEKRDHDLEYQTLGANEWPGALYYKIIPVERRKKTYYTLLGWDGNDRLTTKKVIEVLHFGQNDEVKLGAPIFRENTTGKRKRPRFRVIFEYTNKAVMTLNYEEKQERIVFDHLEPRQENLEGMYEFYGPTLSYDAYVLNRKKEVWEFREKVKTRNPDRGKKYIDPEDP